MAYKAIVTDGKRFRKVCGKFKDYSYAFVCHTEYSLVNADVIQQAIDAESVASVQEVALALGVLIGRASPTDQMVVDVYVSDNLVSENILQLNVCMYNVDVRVHKSRSKAVTQVIEEKTETKEQPDTPPVDLGIDDESIFTEDISPFVTYSEQSEDQPKRKYTRHFSDETLSLLEKAKTFSFREGEPPHIHFTNQGLAFLNDLLEHKIPMTAIASATGISPTCIHDAKRKLSLMSTREIRSLYNSENNITACYDKDSPKVLLVCKNLRGKPLTGNYVTDFEQAMWVSLSDEDKNYLLQAFYASDGFDSFCTLVNASSFSYKKEIRDVADIYESLHGIRKSVGGR